MTARFQVKQRAGGYEITADDQVGVLVPSGAQARRIYERWHGLNMGSVAQADAYLEGIAEGLRFKTALTGEHGEPPPEAETEASAYETERIRQLQENRQSAAAQNVDLDERFAPGSFGCHEAMHLTGVLAGVIERELCTHSSVLRDPRWYACARRACDDLAQLYLAIGKAHL